MVLGFDEEVSATGIKPVCNAQAVVENGCVKIVSNNLLLLELPNLWLRDNCPCDDCRVTKTQEKSFILSEVARDLCPDHADISDGYLALTWPDGHITNFELDHIFALSRPRHKDPVNWQPSFSPGYFDWTNFLSDGNYACLAIQSFLEVGAIILDNAPQTEGTLELLAPRLGPIREVLFDRIHNVCIDARVYNVAHTPMALPPHNDFASYSFPPSVQALHMLQNDAEGGKSIIVDAWAIAESIRAERVDFFDSLCQFPVPFREFDESNETFAIEPLFKCDTAGNIISVRFSNQLMQTIDPMQQGVSLFYEAYHDLCCRITDVANRCTFRLQSGQILLVAAHRVLHAREAFIPSGRRHLQDAYFELDNVANQLIQLQYNYKVALA